jgi:acetyl esterase
MTENEKKILILEKTNHFKKIVVLQEKLNGEMNTDGERRIIPLDNRNIEIILYNENRKNGAVLFAAFGGGFVFGGCALDNAMWLRLAHELDCQLVSVGYRKSLNAPYPAAVYDFYEIIDYCVQHHEEYGFDINKIMTFGSSAGANIAAAAAILDRKNNTCFIKTQILNYPYLDSLKDPADKGFTGDELISSYVYSELYIPDREKRKEIMASPALCRTDQLMNMPVTVINIAGADLLRFEANEYGIKLLEVGNEVFIKEYPHMPHGFFEFYFSLNDPHSEKSFCPEEIKKCHLSGTLAEQSEEVIRFIKDKCL